MFSNSSFEALNVSKRLKDLEIKVRRTKGLPLKLPPLASLVDPSKETTASNIAVTGRFFDSVTKEAHICIANERNAVFLNANDRRPLLLVQSTTLIARSMTHHLLVL